MAYDPYHLLRRYYDAVAGGDETEISYALRLADQASDQDDPRALEAATNFAAHQCELELCGECGYVLIPFEPHLYCYKRRLCMSGDHEQCFDGIYEGHHYEEYVIYFA